MRHLIKKGITLAITAMITAGCIAGCGSASKKMDASVMAMYGDEAISKEEAEFLARYTQYSYESIYTSYYGVAASQIWSSQMGGTETMEETVKTGVMSELLQTRILRDEANKQGITLTDDDQTKIDEQAAAFMAMTDVIEAANATEETVKTVITNNALANKIYEQMVADIDTNVPEEDVLNKTMAVVTIKEKEETEETTDASAEETADTSAEETTAEETKSSEEIKEMKQKMEELGHTIQTELEAGKTADEIKMEYEGSEFEVTTSADTAVSKSSTYDYAEQAMALTLGQCTTVSADSDTPAVYAVRCEEEKNEKATQEAIEQELDSRRGTMFQEKYAELVKNAPDFKVNEDQWALVRFDNTIYQQATTAETGAVEEAASGAETQTAEPAAVTETQAAETAAVTETQTAEPAAVTETQAAAESAAATETQVAETASGAETQSDQTAEEADITVGVAE